MQIFAALETLKMLSHIIGKLTNINWEMTFKMLSHIIGQLTNINWEVTFIYNILLLNVSPWPKCLWLAKGFILKTAVLSPTSSGKYGSKINSVPFC